MSAPGDTPEGDGLFATLRKLGNSVVSAVQTRLELLSVELQEEKWRLVELLVYTAALVFLSVTAVLMVTLTIVVLVGDDLRPWFLAGFSLLYALGALAAFRGLRACLKERPPPFASTLAELRKDSEWLTRRK